MFIQVPLLVDWYLEFTKYPFVFLQIEDVSVGGETPATLVDKRPMDSVYGSHGLSGFTIVHARTFKKLWTNYVIPLKALYEHGDANGTPSLSHNITPICRCSPGRSTIHEHYWCLNEKYPFFYILLCWNYMFIYNKTTIFGYC